MKTSDSELELRIKQMEEMITRKECKRDDLKRQLSDVEKDIYDIKAWWVILKEEQNRRKVSSGK